MTEVLKIGILVSGSGSNLQSLIDHIERGTLSARIQIVISNNPDAYALKRAQNHGLPHAVINHRDFATREEFEMELRRVLISYNVELVVLAGFMRVLSPFFLKAFPQRVINIHPALLPSFPGVHAQKQAWDYGVKFTGCTVHFVDEGVDTGPIIIQSVVPVYENDTQEILSERILKEEHRILPRAVQLYALGRLVVQDGKVRIKDGENHPLPALHNPPLAGF